MKRPFLYITIVLIFQSTAYGCCGCSLVSAGMGTLKRTVQTSMRTMDRALERAFDMKTQSNEELTSDIEETSLHQTALSKENIKCYESIGFELEQINSLQDTNELIELQDEVLEEISKNKKQ